VHLLIFDLDGTLADTKDDLAFSVNLTLKEMNLPRKDPAVIYGYVGNGVKKLLQQAVGGDHHSEKFRTALRLFRGHYLTHLLDRTRLYPGMDVVLDHFRDVKKAVVTNKLQEYTDRLLKGLGVMDRFDLVLGGAESLRLKPEPDMLHEVIEKLKVRPDRAVMIGDSANDVAAAHAAGIRACAVGYGLGDAEELHRSGPDWTIKRPEELITLFGRSEQRERA
jgi:phosphoglycolate phosphatase